ncbi:M3 family metallopeptidase [Sphingomonas montana]|uniref:M3 family metallopeptidase n=1 Tax=Sphingomonas montana TaxID=1843236 RepID=UPI00096EF170|nr:M3 family metallopeptidase [Sphingomonas montana]
MAANPLLADWDTPFGAPPFNAIRPAHFLPALEIAMAEKMAEIRAIADATGPATFDSVIAALERSGAALSRVRRVFWTLSSAHGEPGIRAIEAEISARMSAHGTAIDHDPALFARVAEVWRGRATAGLTAEQIRLTDNVYHGFVNGGAGLAPADKARFAAIDARLAALSVAFGQNVMGAAGDWSLLTEAHEVGGLPQAVCDVAAARAAAEGMAGRYRFTLDRGDFETVTTFATDRVLRETMWRGFTQRCDGGAHDNNPLVAEIVALRRESAALLGHATYADYKLADSMAASPDAAHALLMRLWEPARAKAITETATLQLLADRDGVTIAPWDWRFYAEQVRREAYALDAGAVRALLSVDGVRDAAFDVAGRLYGLRFVERPDIAVYHPDMHAWDVRDAAGEAVGLLYTDYFARPTKHGGAWMGSLRVQERIDGPVLPIVYTVANFSKAPVAADSRVSLDEARTLFHEFGHALHALLSDVTYPSLAGTAVARDFVEFPSKFMEHWIVAPEVLRGFGMDDAMIAAIGAGDGFGQGFSTVELTGSSIVDLALHRATGPVDAAAFEAEMLATLRMPDAIVLRHRLPHFTHVFDGGYAAAYYSYLWAEVLDEDAFDSFAQPGRLFDWTLAKRFRDEVLARGDSRDPMESFVAFRGRTPDEAPLLRQRGLVG